MKIKWNYYKIKWTSFFFTVILLSAGFVFIYFKNKAEPVFPLGETEEAKPSVQGYYTNEDFGKLIEINLSELGFLEHIFFRGTADGCYTIQATLSDPQRFAAICDDVLPYNDLLMAMKDETFLLEGHLGENANGNGCFISDSITIAGHKIPAAFATEYIEKYTGLNDLLEAPIDQIALNENGVTFHSKIPTFIQTALYTPSAR